MFIEILVVKRMIGFLHFDNLIGYCRCFFSLPAIASISQTLYNPRQIIRPFQSQLLA